MRTVHSVLDSGTGPNLDHNIMLPLGWLLALNTQTPLLSLIGANGQLLKLLRAVRLRFLLGNAHIRVDFFVTPSLAAPLMICTSFMD